MSPEQARGKDVEREPTSGRSVAFFTKCSPGNRSSPGETTTMFLRKCSKASRRWDALPAGTPASIRKLLERL